jgi:hypothetical protein
MGVEEQGVCPQQVVTVLLGSVSWSSIPRGPGLEREGSPSIEGKEGRGERRRSRRDQLNCGSLGPPEGPVLLLCLEGPSGWDLIWEFEQSDLMSYYYSPVAR